MPSIITVGEVLVEVMTKVVGQEFLSPGELIGPFPSGAPAIFIDQAARMGVDCGMIARVGNDDFGSLNINRLKQDGVDTTQILRTQGYTTGTAFVTYFQDGRRKFIFHFAHSAAGQLKPEDINEDYIASGKYLHIMGCSLSVGDDMRNSILKAVRVAKQNGITVSFDPNLRVELLGDKKVKTVFDEMLSMTDILLSGESEIKVLTGNSSIEDTISKLRNGGISIIVLKNGSKGIKVYSGSVYEFIPSMKVVEVDPTGAGDCFDGAFLAALVQGMDIKAAATIANAAGALSVTKKGPMEGAHFKNEILEFIARSEN